MPEQSIWASINVPLPSLRYENVTTAGQGKGSTEWAPHSHTPLAVVEWTDFDELVAAEGEQPRNTAMIDVVNLEEMLKNQAEFFNAVSEEEHVTDSSERLLGVFALDRLGLSGGFGFQKRSNELISKPDLVAIQRNDAALGVGDFDDYKSPEKGTEAGLRRDNVAMVRSLVRFPFETKPCWKFRFLCHAHAMNDLVTEWEVPEEFDQEKMGAKDPLPLHWTPEKKKIFHVVRQLFGQMVADHHRYGILHVYEYFFFCKRTPESTFMVSRAFGRRETTPSVLQGIKTMVGFTDYVLRNEAVHLKSASKVAKILKSNTRVPRLPPGFTSKNSGSAGSSKKDEQGRKEQRGKKHDASENLAASLCPWDCQVYDATDNVLLMTSTKYPGILIKMQQNPRQRHVGAEMRHEAEIYSALNDNEAVQEAIVAFHGHSTRHGVAMTCVERELDDLGDMGLENVSDALKDSAVHAVSLLSDAGVLHNDLELRNFVQSKDDPDRVKIIDFGRAVFTSDQALLSEQVERVKVLMGVSQ